MSVNTLLDNPSSQSKPWCNIYVDKLTSYKGATIKGPLEVDNAGAIGNVLTKTATGTEWLPAAGGGVNPGNNGQFLKTEGGTVQWKDFDISSIPKGLPNQVVKTDENEMVTWDYPITPGIPNQVLVSSPSLLGPIGWSSNLIVDDISFFSSGNIPLNYYREKSENLLWTYESKTVGTTTTWTRVGNIVTMIVTGFTLTMDTGDILSLDFSIGPDIILPSEDVTMVISCDMPSVPGRNLAVVKATPSQMYIYSLSVGESFPAGVVTINPFTISYICA